MLKISEFFKRIQGRQSKEFFIRSTVQTVLQKNIGINIPVESISFNSDTVILNNIPQAARSTIFIKKQAIIAEINSQQQFRKISDIR